MSILETVYVGWLSILPPVIAIVLALFTKQVLFSLLAGVFFGTTIYTFAAGLNPIAGPVQVTFDLIIQRADMYILVFCFLLGALVYLIKVSGGAEAYGRWASKYIRTRRQSQILTFVLGCLIFVDDYFNCLTIGTVMKPVTDRYKVSRAKLSYIIDTTAAPICIIAPISSWAAAVGSHLKSTGAFESDFLGFVSSIPYNFYALLSLIMVLMVCIFKLDFGPMAKYEALAQKGDLGSIEDDTEVELESTSKGTVADMLVPIVVLIVVSIISMLYIGGFWGTDPAFRLNFVAALGNSVAAQALVWGNFAALIVALLMYVPRKIMSFKQYMDNIVKGMSGMVTSACILLLAWAIGGLCRDLLGTPEFVKVIFQAAGISGVLLPSLIFILAAGLSFSTGTSWGTFGILIPIVVPVAQLICPELLVASLAATLSGSIFGDHCSPISDTTILSSTGAGVNHLVHVTTQMPYALTVAGCSLIGYILIGLTKNLYISLGASIILLLLVVMILHRRSKTKVEKVLE